MTLSILLSPRSRPITILYALLLALAAMVLWQPRFLFTWLFNAMFQMARYPVGLYPGWLRLVLTWIVPVGLMTTVPAQALSGMLSAWMLAASLILAALLTWIVRAYATEMLLSLMTF